MEKEIQKLIYFTDPGKDYKFNKFPKGYRTHWSPSKRVFTMPFDKHFGVTYFILKGVSLEQFSRCAIFNGIFSITDFKGSFTVLPSYKGIVIKGFGNRNVLGHVADPANFAEYYFSSVKSKCEINLNIFGYISHMNHSIKEAYANNQFGFNQYWYFAHRYIMDIASFSSTVEKDIARQFKKPRIKYSLVEIDSKYKYAIRQGKIYAFSKTKKPGFRKVENEGSKYFQNGNRDVYEYRMNITPEKDMKVINHFEERNILHLYYFTKDQINSRPKDKLDVINSTISEFPKRLITMKKNKSDYPNTFKGRYMLLEDLYKTQRYNFKEMYQKNMEVGEYYTKNYKEWYEQSAEVA